MDLLSGKKIIIFGTGSFAEKIDEEIRIKVSYYVDNNSNKWGTYFRGKEIRSPDCLLKEDKQKLIIFIASTWYEDIAEQLEKMGFQEGEHYLLYSDYRELIIEYNGDLPMLGDCILFEVKSSWGEAEGFLPIMYKLKEMYPHYKIVTFFATSALLKQWRNNPLQILLRKVSDIVIFSKEYSQVIDSYKMIRLERILIDVLKKDNIKAIINDGIVLSETIKYLLSKVKSIPIIGYPPGNSPLYLQDREYIDTSFFETVAKIQLPEYALRLVGYECDVKWMRELYKYQGEISVVGHPRYDRWWITKYLSYIQESIANELSTIKSKKIVSFFTRTVHPIYLPKRETFEYLVNSVAELVSHEKDTTLLIKPHPRQDMEELKSILNHYDGLNWRISLLPTMALAKISDYVIAMFSSTILDSAILGKPNIEFYIFEEVGGPTYIKRENGELCSSMNYFGYCDSVSTFEELKGYKEKYLNSKQKVNIFSERQKKLEELFNGSAERAVNAIMQII